MESLIVFYVPESEFHKGENFNLSFRDRIQAWGVIFHFNQGYERHQQHIVFKCMRPPYYKMDPYNSLFV